MSAVFLFILLSIVSLSISGCSFPRIKKELFIFSLFFLIFLLYHCLSGQQEDSTAIFLMGFI